MATPTRVVAGNEIEIADLNQLIDLLEGASSMTEAFKFVSSSGENFIVKLSDAAGVRKFQIQDSTGTEVAYIDSDGNLVVSGGFTPAGTLIVPSSTNPATTTEGAIQWDSDDDVLMMGTGSVAKKVSPYVAAGATASNKGEIAHNTTTGQTSIHNGTSSVPIAAGMFKVRSTSQSWTSDAELDPISADSGTFTFTGVAGQSYVIEAFLQGTTTGTGGGQIALTNAGGSSTASTIRQIARVQEASGNTVTVSTNATLGTALTGMIVQNVTTNIHYICHLTVGTGGSFALEFAQGSSNGTAVTLNWATFEVRSVITAA